MFLFLFRVGPGRLMMKIMSLLSIVMVNLKTTPMIMISISASGQIPMILQCIILEMDYIIKT